MTTALTIHVEDDHLGPAMKVLTEKQRSFVYALVQTGGNAAQAAASAGYGANSHSPEARENAYRVRGYQLSHDVKVLAAIKEEAEKRLHSGALIAASALLEMATDPLNKNRFKASVELLNRAGLTVATEHKVTVEHRGNTGEIGARIRELVRELGPDLQRIAGPDTAAIIDAEYSDVTPTRSGLEDLL